MINFDGTDFRLSTRHLRLHLRALSRPFNLHPKTIEIPFVTRNSRSSATFTNDPDEYAFPFQTINLKPADRMSAAARIDEVGQILAAALSRIQGRQSSTLSANIQENSIDILALKSGVHRRNRRN